MRLECAPDVEDDLVDIASFIGRHNPRRAESYVAELHAAILTIEARPFAYPLRPEIGPDARSLSHGSYLILFRVLGEVVRVERVVHGARDMRRMLL